jgi:hypothetical protein
VSTLFKKRQRLSSPLMLAHNSTLCKKIRKNLEDRKRFLNFATKLKENASTPRVYKETI